MSSHNLSWILGLAAHVILMGDHKIVCAGPTMETSTAELFSRAYGKAINVQWTSGATGLEIAMCIAS